MKTNEIRKNFIGNIIFHVANNNEVEKLENCDNQAISTMYIENDVLNVVTKDAQYLYNFNNYKNIES